MPHQFHSGVQLVQQELNLDYDGKRDRWNGFQADDYKQVIEEKLSGA